jgi:hypothetical protein
MFKKNVKRVLVLALAFSQIANANPNLLVSPLIVLMCRINFGGQKD